MRRLVLTLVLFALAPLVTPVLGASYNVAVQTGQTFYAGNAHIAINGTVSPAPGPNTAVIVVISNPSNAAVDIQNDAVDPATGSFNQTTVAGGGLSCGGSPCWTEGTYVVNATWAGDGSSATMVTTFLYSPSTPENISVSCAPASLEAGAPTQCTASVSGGGTSTDGEKVAFSQTAGSGGVSFPSLATCVLSGNSCLIALTGGSPGQATIQATYPGDAVHSASSGTTNVTVTQATTITAVSCTPSDAGGAVGLEVGLSSSCTATVSGSGGAISGETLTFSQTGGNGSVTLPSSPTCALSSAGGKTSCQIDVTARSAGSVTIHVSYSGDTDNVASAAITTIDVMLVTTTSSQTSTSTPTSTTASSVSSTASKSTESTTASSSVSSGTGSGSSSFSILAAVAAVFIVVGIVIGMAISRRKMVGGPGTQPAQGPSTSSTIL